MSQDTVAVMQLEEEDVVPVLTEGLVCFPPLTQDPGMSDGVDDDCDDLDNKFGFSM